MGKYTHKKYMIDVNELKINLGTTKLPFKHMELRSWDGGLVFNMDRPEYTPKEAVRIAKWILDYYGKNPEEVV